MKLTKELWLEYKQYREKQLQTVEDADAWLRKQEENRKLEQYLLSLSVEPSVENVSTPSKVWN